MRSLQSITWHLIKHSRRAAAPLSVDRSIEGPTDLVDVRRVLREPCDHAQHCLHRTLHEQPSPPGAAAAAEVGSGGKVGVASPDVGIVPDR